MSARRADQEDQPSTSALPPTLFQLPDLDRPRTAPETESTMEMVGDENPDMNQGMDDNHAEMVTESSVASGSSMSRGNGSEGNGSEGNPPNNVPVAIQPTVASAAANSSTGSDSMNRVGPDALATDTPSASSDIPPGDQPAGRGWMESLGSNRSIAVMLVLVFLAAWWTAPNYHSFNDRVSDEFANADAPPNMNSQEMANFVSEDSTRSEQQIAAATSVAAGNGSLKPPNTATANFDAEVFGAVHPASPVEELPTPPSLANSQIQAQVVATPTSNDVLGNLEQMAYQRDFGVAPDASVAAALQNSFAETQKSFAEPGSLTPASTATPTKIDWTRYLPTKR